MKSNCKYSIILAILFVSFAAADTIPPAKPTGLSQISYEKHIDLTWNANTEPDLGGYRIYKRQGNEFLLYTIITGTQQWFTEWYGSLGTGNSYKISAFDQFGNESELTDSITTLTKEMSDEEFLDMTQRATFRYFWDYAHPYSGLARERTNSGNTVTIGGSGFGVMALLVGIHRGYITREQGRDRLLKIVNFLTNRAQRYHGAFSHWLDGQTGTTIPFSTYDNGGDLVETSFMIQGLLAARQYFDGADTNEVKLRQAITSIWEAVEWTWYRRASFSPHLYWHWSPNYGWQMNFKLVGWNETMICYLLGIASPTYKILASSFSQGFASSSNYVNGNYFYGYKLFVGSNYGGPLFFAHYSFLGFDPRFKKDQYANYFLHNQNHALIHRAYCAQNPKGHQGYNENSWGLTACDNPWGYSAHEPHNNDNGTIAPTAALASMPYTPTESVGAIKYFYRTHGNKLWGSYGFKDAFNMNQSWFAPSYLAIDQGPIIVMIENHRSGLIWNKFMANPEIQMMVDSLFTPDSATSVKEREKDEAGFSLNGNYPNPFKNITNINFSLPAESEVNIIIYNLLGRRERVIRGGNYSSGAHSIAWDGRDDSGKPLPQGAYFFAIEAGAGIKTGKLTLIR
ncbi:MAG: T9SS type A sorting domain-containing protein [Ignavibacteriaceae bacterium]|nr:T9SS type A sorting domain-containing protein [Ignavibacteriaceae bacterium]